MTRKILFSALCLFSLTALLQAKHYAPTVPSVGLTAPEFSLPDENGKFVTLESFKGKTVVLYFYPKDESPGCTREACDFRDHWKEVRKKGAILIGISVDSPDSHRAFRNNHSLPFILLSDMSKVVLKRYGVWGEVIRNGNTSTGTIRSTFLIGPNGHILKIWSPVDVDGHVIQVLRSL